MPNPETLDRLVRRVATQVRRRRVEHYALRGAFWASMVAVLLLAFKGPLAGWALPLAGGVIVLGTLIGAAWGAFKRTSVADAARLADRAWGLQDRVATAMDWVGRPDRPPLVDALIADTLQRIERLEPRQAARRVIPRDGRFLPIPLALAVVLALAPAIPVPSGRLPDFSSGAEEEQPEQRAGTALTDERARPAAKDRLKPPSFEEREFASRTGGTGAAMSGDLSAVFKDTALSAQRPDFQSFLKKGDERLKLLEQADRLPDLQSDFTASQYKMMFRKSKSLSGGLRPDQISPQKLKELLEEMERLGRKGGANCRATPPRAWKRWKVASPIGQWTRCSGRWTRCGRRRNPHAPARTSRAAARAIAAIRRAATVAVVRAAGPTIRISARAKVCCPARAAAARPRVRRPSGCAAIPTTSASRANHGAGARTGTTPT